MAIRTEAVAPAKRRALAANAQLWIGAVLLVLVAIAAVAVAPALGDPNKQDMTAVLQGPSLAHPFGTDNVGRDQLSRVVWGARASLLVSLGSVGLAALFGIPLGMIAGYFRGMLDQVISVVADSLLSLPAMVLALTLSATLGPGLGNTLIAICVINVPQYIRLARGQTLSISQRLYVEAARAAGAGHAYILVRYVFPNILSPILASACLMLSTATLVESSLSFLGVGIAPPTASWGYMMRVGSSYIQMAPWLAILPGLALFVTALGYNLLGDGLQRVLLGSQRGAAE